MVSVHTQHLLPLRWSDMKEIKNLLDGRKYHAISTVYLANF